MTVQPALKKKLQLLMSGDGDPYTFTSDSLPADHRFLPPLANGLLGWRVYNSTMHMGGVYNGGQGECHRAEVPCPIAVTVDSEEVGQDSYALDAHTGCLLSTYFLMYLFIHSYSIGPVHIRDTGELELSVPGDFEQDVGHNLD